MFVCFPCLLIHEPQLLNLRVKEEIFFLSYIGFESDKTCIQIPNLSLIDNVSLGNLHNLFSFSSCLKIVIIIPQSIVDIGLIEMIVLVEFSCSVVSDSL